MENISDMSQILKRLSDYYEYEANMKTIKERQNLQEDKERQQINSIDWMVFTVVETIDILDSE